VQARAARYGNRLHNYSEGMGGRVREQASEGRCAKESERRRMCLAIEGGNYLYPGTLNRPSAGLAKEAIYVIK